MRPIKIIPDYLRNASGSCLFCLGNTQVICGVSVSETVPAHALEKNIGWLSAEYNFLPLAGERRTPRNSGLYGGRSKEISRLIGRSIRAILNLEELSGYALTLDCDVLQADGGTRVAAINGGFIAVVLALDRMYREKKIPTFPVRDYLGAISVGIVAGKKVVDLKASQDNRADVDVNVVMTGRRKLVEVQATAEQVVFTFHQLQELLGMAAKAIDKIIRQEKRILKNIPI